MSELFDDGYGLFSTSLEVPRCIVGRMTSQYNLSAILRHYYRRPETTVKENAGVGAIEGWYLFAYECDGLSGPRSYLLP